MGTWSPQALHSISSRSCEIVNEKEVLSTNSHEDPPPRFWLEKVQSKECKGSSSAAARWTSSSSRTSHIQQECCRWWRDGHDPNSSDVKAKEAEIIHPQEDAQKVYEDYVKSINGSIEAKSIDIVNKSVSKCSSQMASSTSSRYPNKNAAASGVMGMISCECATSIEALTSTSRRCAERGLCQEYQW